MIDVNAIIQDYTTNTTATSATLATTYGCKPSDIAAILRLNGIKLRRGAPGNLSDDARAKSAAARRRIGLHSGVRRLVSKYGAAEVAAAFNTVTTETQPEINADT